jgi:glucose/mannose-6-phosphate isomerase
MLARGGNLLDDQKLIATREKSDRFGAIKRQPAQLAHDFGIAGQEVSKQTTYNVLFCGMGGSSLVAELVHTWPRLIEPFVVNKSYDIPAWVDQDTLVIVSSYSGNTEETLSALEQAEKAGAQIAVIAHGGKLKELAQAKGYLFAEIPESTQPRAGVFYMYRAVVEIFIAFGLIEATELEKLKYVVHSLEKFLAEWAVDVAEKDNLAKQLASKMLGKTPIIYGGPLTYPAAYKWKIDVNENAKNTAWCNQLPEFNHNEFLGWSSHPIEKPFAIIDLISEYEHPRVLKRFKVTDRLLSGKRPKSTEVHAKGDSVHAQLLYLVLLGDMATTYLAILNNVDPAPVELVERFKKELD